MAANASDRAEIVAVQRPDRVRTRM